MKLSPEQELIEAPQDTWRPIEEAPRDGTEVLITCVDDSTGPLLGRYVCLLDFLLEDEIEEQIAAGSSRESIEEPDWFIADFICGCRLNLTPTHFMPLPKPPEGE